MLELYGSRSCQYTSELREALEWQGRDFMEYDVEVDASALRRMQAATGGLPTVPVLIEDGKVLQIGWQGRGCVIAKPQS